MTSRLHIDWTTCHGRGLCTEIGPELLDRDEWGYPIPREGGDPAIPYALRGLARQAVAQCPRLALSIIND